MSKPFRIPAPAPGSRKAFPVNAAKVLALDFDTAEFDASRNRDDLVFEGNGGRVAITGFFALPDHAMPDILLPSGDLLAGADMRDALGNGPDDIITG